MTSRRDYAEQHLYDEQDWRTPPKEAVGEKKQQAVLRRRQKIERFRQKTDFRRLTVEAE